MKKVKINIIVVLLAIFASGYGISMTKNYYCTHDKRKKVQGKEEDPQPATIQIRF